VRFFLDKPQKGNSFSLTNFFLLVFLAGNGNQERFPLPGFFSSFSLPTFNLILVGFLLSI